ncbi:MULTISPECIES: hypothetical protein [Kitasatospora]|uniref:hypothetical protein n=1 Tax=Kitasatospora TaxID=2063 RepID=UPI0031D66E21
MSRGCGPFIDVTLDFEPADEGFEFEVQDGILADWEWPEDLPRFFSALARGVREELGHEAYRMAVAVRAVLRAARAHPIDSGEFSFYAGGERAAREAVARAFGEPPRAEEWTD